MTIKSAFRIEKIICNILVALVVGFTALGAQATPKKEEAPSSDAKPAPTTGSQKADEAEKADEITVRGAEPRTGRPLSVVERLNLGLKMTDREKKLTSSIRDNKAIAYKSAFFLMMNKVSNLPELSEDDYNQLPEYKDFTDFVNEPARHRFQKLRTEIKIHKIFPLDMEKYTKFSGRGKYWPDSKKQIYMIHASLRKKRNEVPKSVIVYTTVFPPDLPEVKLTYDEKVGMKGWIYRGRRYLIAGIFYKTIRSKPLDDPKDIYDGAPEYFSYPIILAWQMVAKNKIDVGGINAKEMLYGSIFAIAGIFVIFFLLKRKFQKRRAHGPMWKDYKPLRELDETNEEDEEENIEVDPELVDIVNQYRKERGLDDSRKDQ